MKSRLYLFTVLSVALTTILDVLIKYVSVYVLQHSIDLTYGDLFFGSSEYDQLHSSSD